MNLHATPPADWDQSVDHPFLLSAWAEASRATGLTPYYASDGQGQVLVQLRGHMPILGRCIGRAYLSPSARGHALVAELIRHFRRRGIPYIRVGNSMCGLPFDDRARTLGGTVVHRHTHVLDLARTEKELLRAMEGAERKIRKATREGVHVRALSTLDDLDRYYALSVSTYERAKSVMMLLPRPFFRSVYSTMVPKGQARFYLAESEANGELLAGALFLVHHGQMLYYHGASTRDRKYTDKQAPSALFWRAITAAQREGLRYFDFGGCTPTEDASDPRYGVYRYKKQWGGELTSFANLEVVNSPWTVRVQERVLAPLWDLYLAQSARLSMGAK